MAQQSRSQPGGKRSQPGSPWPARIVGGVIILSILAIGLGVFLPRERSEQQPQPNEQVAENPTPATEGPRSTGATWQQSRQAQQTQRQEAPQAQRRSAMSRASQQPQQQSQQQPSPLQQRQDFELPSSQPTRMERAPQQSPSPAQQATSPAPAPATSTRPSPSPSASQRRSDVRQPSPSPRNAPSRAPAPSQQPRRPAPRPAAQPRPLFTPQQARRVAQQAEQTERGQRWGQLQPYIAMLQREDFQDPENWQLMQTALATTGSGMIPGGPSQGHGEVMALITKARNGREAAAMIRQYGQKSPGISLVVQQQIAGVLSTATTEKAALDGLDRVLKTTNTQLTPQTTLNLRQAVAQAVQSSAAIR